ncbi:MaoC/PaaZ C-terminal domain-containing protein, partial [Bacillus sp. S1-R5C1-FB]|uniref:MaoC/PaaZ C-terminal domain-containing protein n=1 Tax=Bacillus sp. S1-R5C1-FB TaxID=1973491 RepID=UPI003519D7D3
MTEPDFVLFAGLSGDFNPIHSYHDYATQTRFNQNIAHVLLTSSLLSPLLGIHLPGKGSVYMEQTIKSFSYKHLTHHTIYSFEYAGF